MGIIWCAKESTRWVSQWSVTGMLTFSLVGQMLGAGREGELENGNLDRDGSPANLVAGADTQGKKK